MENADDMLRAAVALHQSGKLDDARRIYERILQLDARDPNALNLLGMVHHQHGRLDQAEELIARAVEIAPQVPGFHNNLGTVLLALRRTVDSETALRHALTLQPDYPEAMNNLAVALTGQGRFDEAIERLTRCLALRHVYPSARNNLGNVLRAMRMYRQAVACYHDAIAQQSDHVDSWSNLAITLLEMHDLEPAEQAARRALTLAPDQAMICHTLGLILEAQGRTGEAIAMFEDVLRRRPDAELVRFHLDSLQGRQGYDAVPPTFVRGLFDHYADTFDRHLIEVLNYRAPELLSDAVQRVAPQRLMDIADLGCGTGLCGPLFKPLAKSLVGVDLSARMIHQARQRGVYDELFVQDLKEFLTTRAGRFDLLLAADVLIYFGDLAPVLSSAARALRVGGLFGFTIEKQDDDETGYRLQPTRRFTHSLAYVRSLLAGASLREASISQSALRKQDGADVPGWVVVLSKPG